MQLTAEPLKSFYLIYIISLVYILILSFKVLMVMGQKINLPRGFRFYPKDEELISWYLKPKILGQKMACNFINTAELYGPNSTPWQLFHVNDDNIWMDSYNNHNEKFLYAFTTLSKLRTSHGNKVTCRDNTCKKAGCGTWVGKTNCKIRDSMGNVIGVRRLLIFEINDIGAQFDQDKVGYFKMHEYSLCGVNKGLKSCVGDLVLCKITYDSSKNPSYKLASKNIDHVSKNVPKFNDHECQNNNENLEGQSVEVDENFEGQSVGVGDNDPEGAETLTSNSVVEISSGVGDNIEGKEHSTSERLFEMDNSFSDFDDFIAIGDQYNNGFQEFNEFSEGPTFDMSWFMEFLSSDQENEPVEDISMLGKRKFEEENLNGTKKMCL